MSTNTLDLIGVVCPINFVRTKLKLETLNIGDELFVLLDDGEPIESVSKSIFEEGQEIISKTKSGDYWKLLIRKIK